MSLTYQPPFQINPNARSGMAESLSELNKTMSGIGDSFQDSRYKKALLELQRRKEARDQGIYDYEYGSPTGTSGPQPSGWAPQGTTGPQPQSSMPGVDPNFGDWNAQTASEPVDHTANFLKWKQGSMGATPGYEQTSQNTMPQPMGGGGPTDEYANLMRMPGAKRRAEALGFMKERRQMEGTEADTRLKSAQAEWYKRRYAGGPRGGSGTDSDPTKMTTRDITAYRNQISKDLLYGIPGTPEYEEGQAYLQVLDDELQNRLRRNRTPRTGGTNTPPMGPQASQDPTAWLKKNFPNYPATARNLSWAQQQMSKSGR